MQVQTRHVCLQCWIEGSSAARRKLANLAASRAIAGSSRSIASTSISATSVDAGSSIASASSAIAPVQEETAPLADRGRFQRSLDSPSQRPSGSFSDASIKAKSKGKGKGKTSLTELLLAARRSLDAPGSDTHGSTEISPEQGDKLDEHESAAPDAHSRKPPAKSTTVGKHTGKKPLTRKAKAKARAEAKRKQGEGAGKTSAGDIDGPVNSMADELGASSSSSTKAKSVRARKKTPLRAPNRKKAQAEPSSSLGSDSLRPTSESGFTITSDPFGSILPEDKKAVATRMEELMKPLFAECLKLDGSEQEKEVRALRKVLKHYILQYRKLKKQGSRTRAQERFIREVLQESRWSPVRAGEVEDERSAGWTASEEASGETAIDGDTAASRSHAEKAKRIPFASISASDIKIAPIAPPHGPVEVASLAHGLERVLFQSGTHWLQDPRTSHYNYPKSCGSIPKIADFDFDRLPRFMKPSSDPDLALLLKSSGKKFAGSTSSLTSALSQIYFALNGTKPLNTQSQSFVDEPREFSAGIRLPASIILNMTEDGNYIIDADKSADIGAADNPLSEKGHILEKLLTHTPADFERFLKASTNPLRPEESRDKREAYHYSSTSSLLMRSQLDCHDDRLPRKTFDIKTRGSIALRRDMLNHLSASGYQITSLTGHLSSFEREKYDLIRSAFLKYSMQVRIGAMDGIFLAYHSGEQIFGFEYLPLEELDKFISGSFEESQQAFQLCLGTLETLLERAVADIPGKSLRLSFEGYRGALQVYAQPLDADAGSELIPQPAELPRGVTAADSHTPLLLYDVLIRNQLNGEPIAHGKPVDFATIRNNETAEGEISAAAAELAQEEDAEVDEEDAAQEEQEALAEEMAAGDAIAEPETAFTSAFEEVMSSSTGATVEPAAAESATHTTDHASPATVPAIEWSITLDVAQSTDQAFNYSRLERLRKRQSKFSAGVVLPEGLTSAEEARALKGAQSPEEEEAFRKEGEDGHAWNGGTFIPRFGVTYTKRKYGIIGELRRLNKVGRAKMDAAQGGSSDLPA